MYTEVVTLGQVEYCTAVDMSYVSRNGCIARPGVDRGLHHFRIQWNHGAYPDLHPD